MQAPTVPFHTLDGPLKEGEARPWTRLGADCRARVLDPGLASLPTPTHHSIPWVYQPRAPVKPGQAQVSPLPWALAVSDPEIILRWTRQGARGNSAQGLGFIFPPRAFIKIL